MPQKPEECSDFCQPMPLPVLVSGLLSLTNSGAPSQNSEDRQKYLAPFILGFGHWLTQGWPPPFRVTVHFPFRSPERCREAGCGPQYRTTT
jgi:hypothetical protein